MALLVVVWLAPSQRSLDAALGSAAGGMPFVVSDESSRKRTRTATSVWQRSV